MSKDAWFGTTLDAIWKSKATRNPGFGVYIWNPNRTSVGEVVLGESESPRYNISQWVTAIDLRENVTFENEEDAVVSTVKLNVIYDRDAIPIQITEKTLLDGTPIRIYQGDDRVPEKDWVCVFTGFLQGNPEVVEESRGKTENRTIQVLAVDRAAAYMNQVVTAKSYDKGDDVGRAAIETAIQFMNLDRREIAIGSQQYTIGHEKSQLVDIDVMNGLHQMLFTVGKKPRFDSTGLLVAADTDLDKPPARHHKTKDLIISIKRNQNTKSPNNSVRLLGLDANLTRVEEQYKRLAHGNITSGFFESRVHEEVYFSEDRGKETGGRKAIDTENGFDPKITSLGEIFGGEATWQPFLEEDGETAFGGLITFDTGFAPEIRTILVGTWAVLTLTNLIQAFALEQAAWAAAAAVETLPAASALGVAATESKSLTSIAADTALLGILVSMMELGRMSWELYGVPVQNVFQQICATAQLSGILTEQIREIEIRNDWLYDIDTLAARAKELLKREIIKGWSYEIEMLDDPILDIDDIVQIGTSKYYVTGIRKAIDRAGGIDGTMTVTAWRLA